MQLKNHLNFLGDRNKQEITFHLSGAINKNVVVGVDDFDKVWSYLVLLSKQHTEADILQWKENYHVTDYAAFIHFWLHKGWFTFQTVL